ncbi:MAG: transposase [Candidatus Methanoperedens sp.]|nr:transposase [Candidatus Methanoperedens sp.]
MDAQTSELERHITDMISFRKFLGFSDTIPDYSTVWIFRLFLRFLIRPFWFCSLRKSFMG